MSRKRLLLYITCGVGLYFVGRLVGLVLPHPQTENMKEVDRHIQKITPGWKIYQTTNDGLQLIRFWADTRLDGCFGVKGLVTSQEQVVKVLTFVSNTSPPRPIYSGQLKIVDADYFQEELAIESEFARTNKSSSHH